MSDRQQDEDLIRRGREIQQKAPSHSTDRVSKDIQESADHNPAFDCCVFPQCGFWRKDHRLPQFDHEFVEQPSTSDVFNNPERGMSVRNEPESVSESESSISSTLAEIRERRAFMNSGSTKLYTIEERDADIDTLLSIIDSLQAEKESAVKDMEHWRTHARDMENKALSNIVDAASNMKAEIVKRVREKAEKWDAMATSTESVSWGRKADVARQLATELEAVEPNEPRI